MRAGGAGPAEAAPARVAVVGPGRVGTTLAAALPADRFEVVAVCGRGSAALERFTARIPGARVMPAVAAAQAADLVLVAVPDDVLMESVRRVAAAGGVLPATRWVHTSGAHGLAALRPARLAGATVAACHPAQTFPDPDTARASLPGTAWAVTAEPASSGWAAALVRALGGTPVPVPEPARMLYHAGLTVGANGTAAVVALGRDLLLAAGIPDPAVFLGPLAGASARNAATAGAAALTGPVRRGDAGTVAAHLEELGRDLPEAAGPYRDLARLALAYARRAGLPAPAVDAVAAVLDALAPPRDAAG